MKRKLLLLVFLLIHCWGFSQSELYVLLKKPVNNTPSSEFGNETCRIGDYTYGYSISHSSGKYDSNNNQFNVIIDYEEGSNDDPGYGCSGPCGQFQMYCNGKEIDQTLNLYDSITIDYTGPDPIECEANTCLPIDYHAILLPKITTPSDRRCERDPLFDQYSDGQDHNVTDLVWEYVDKNGNWKELPNDKNRYPLNVSLLDIFGANWRNEFKGNLQLQFKFTAPFTNEVVYSIQKYTITLTECSPDFESYYNLSNTSCSYKSDGKIGVKLSNNINASEQLVATLFKEDSNGDILINQYSTKQSDSTDPTVLVLEDLGGGFFGFNWPKDIDAGSYYFRYQALNIGDTPPKPEKTDDPFWYTLVKTEPSFTIEKATNITFEAERFSDENCVNSKDGKIRVFNVSGGTGEGYEYELNESTDWIPFDPSNIKANEVIIGGRGKGTYKIKVRDSKKCLAK
ncbi:hypothetical protein CSC81_12815 [Tenacibaculum discolor]|uniref:Uncharacterized protein n=1 Tax=Tenacibaculum discolor TaxID=361581 RepID=A0A2G1BRB4_9FLAO|nr:hypothetical protein [Tenacibaculum discolor]MDP2542099.1 hypothetical protein [Tenacibaculum discolor]PHN96603.1 hypothetical protein CSC81_12815 [Tenacibaculum discolor]